MIVADTSAVLDALVGNRDAALAERLGSAREIHAPHLIDVELLHALRRMVSAEAVTADRAEYVREDFADLRLRRYPHEPLAARIWDLRANLTAYDAAFVALAEALDLPLVTCDRRLASASGHGARVELFEG